MRRHLPVLTLLLAAITGLGAQSRATGRGPALEEIRGEQIAAHLRFLAHDLLEGRAPSTRGGELAAEYLAAQLATLGLEPGGDNRTWFQNVSIVESTVDPAFTLTVSGGSGGGTVLNYLADTVAVSGRQDATVPVGGDVVFVGHGIVAPELQWNDYAGVDMKGRIAMIMVNDPPPTAAEPNLFGGKALTYYGRWTYKYEEAARQGAVGAILIHTTESATYPWQVVQSSWSGTQYSIPSVGQPVLALKAWVTEASARAMAARGGKDLDALRAAARSRGAKPVPLGVSVSGTISQRVAQKTSPNVVGVVRGANETQAVVYTSHYDHMGIREAKAGDAPDVDRIFNGAIDNASGVAGVLEIAQAFARAPSRPARSIYFVFTAAEESGLLGSEYFASHLPLPARQWAANINIDVLNLAGRTRDIVLLGADRSTLGAIATAVATPRGRVVGPDAHPERGSFFRSDHFPLAKVGIPALSISEPVEYIGKEPGYGRQVSEAYNEKDYHQPSDEFKASWDYAGAVEDLRLLAELGWRIASESRLPAYHAGDQFARPRQVP